jgi:Mrp family chromosome partitioning ATPase
VILVVGSSGGHGTGLVAANLAVALSRNQPDVTLVCAKLEGSVIPDMVGLPPAPGLTDLLADGVPVGNVGRRLTVAPRLRVITPGSTDGMEAGDLQQDAVDHLLAGLRDAARWVVVEAPPVASGPDVYTLAHAADAVVLVAEVPRTRSDQVLDAVQHLEKVGTTVLGAVLLPSPKAPARRGTKVPGPGSKFRLQGPAVSAVTADGDTASDWSADTEAPTSVHGS